jgi:hypothetical protein
VLLLLLLAACQINFFDKTAIVLSASALASLVSAAICCCRVQCAATVCRVCSPASLTSVGALQTARRR